MVSTPIMILPDLFKGYLLQKDASNVGIGAVLMQETIGIKR